MELKNIMESYVLEKVDEVLNNQNKFCNCPRCRLDIAAKALNILPSRYVVTSRGETYSRAGLLENQFGVDLLTAVLAAAQTVASQPHHNGDDK